MKVFGLLPLLLLGGAAPQDVRAAVQQLQERIARLNGEGLRSQTDPAALAASLAHDPERLFAFVRELPFHPYRGALRGARGTLLAGAANDVDRCLLLKDLLERAPAKPSLRFAFGELPDVPATRLAERALGAVPGLPGYLSPSTSTPDAQAAATKTLTTAAKPRLARHAKALREDREQLEAALKEAGVALVGAEADGVAAKAGALRAHVWLQLEREGRWIDLDPSFAEATSGWAPTAAARTADALPDDLYHGVTLRLVVERRKGEALESEPAYAARRRTADLAGRALNLTLMPEGFDPEKPLQAQLPKFTRFQAVVDLGGPPENTRVFDLQGRVLQSRDGKFAADSGAVAGERVLGGLGGRKPPATQLAGLRLEVDVDVPGEPVATTQRRLFERGGPPLGLLQSWSIWPAVGTLNEAFQIERISRLLAKNGGIPGLIFEPGKLAEAAARVDALPYELIGAWQSALRLAQGAFRRGEGACYPDRPSIFFWKEGLAAGAKGDAIRRAGVDLAQAPLGCIARAPLDAARARFMYGLLLTEGESALMERPGAVVFSAAAVFRRAREAKLPVRVLRGGVEAPHARMRDDLKAGFVIVVPREAVEIGGRKASAWWRLDPTTGALLGIGDTGEGQAVSEGVLVLENISIPMVQRCLKFVVCLNVGVGAGRSMQDAGRECMSEFMRDLLKETIEGAVNHFVIDPFKGKAKDRALDDVGEALDDPQLKQFYELARDAYGAAAEKLDGLSGQAAILLAMGSEIAEYAAQKNQDFRNR